MMVQQIIMSVAIGFLVILAGFLIRKFGPPETGGTRNLLFMLMVGLLLAASFPAARYISQNYLIITVLQPVFIGVFALTILNAGSWTQMTAGQKKLAAGLAITQAIFLIGYSLAGWAEGSYLFLLPGVLLVLAWRFLRRANLIVWLNVAGLAYLAASFVSFEISPNMDEPVWIIRVVFGSMYVSLPLIMILAAALFYTTLQPASMEGARTVPNASGRLWRLSLVLLIVGMLAYTIFWNSVWDQTNDGLGGIFMMMFSATPAIAAGLVMTIKFNGPRRLAGIAFTILVPLLLNGVFNLGWQVSYHDLTDARAEQIQAALERYHARHGRYPSALAELVPGELLVIQGPVQFRGEDWCYQGAADGYRLAAFYHEFFGMTVTLREYASAGLPFETPLACEARLAEMKSRFEWSMNAEAAYQVPAPAAQPTSQVPVMREHAQPLLEGASINGGSWSPDGKTWLFSMGEGPGMQATANLHFLNSENGQVCPAGAQYSAGFNLYQRYAWLPDGRLLTIDMDGALYVLQPCEPDAEEISSRYPVRFKEVAKGEAQSGRLLLSAEEGYYILDGNTLEVWPVPGVTPNPYEAHWDNFTWVPGGSRLAISRLNGRDARQGSTLYWIDGDTGAVLTSLEIRDASDQSAPMIEWLAGSQLLLHGQGDLYIYDFASDPPQVTSVMKDLFSLDLNYPYETASMAALARPDGAGYHLLLRASHPRNQAVYWFDSQAQQVSILNPPSDALLFLPGGQWTPLPKSSQGVPARDAFDVYQLNAGSSTPQTLLVEGHLPREYPHLGIDYLAGRSQLVFTSQQGVSLVSLPEGELLRFWELAGGGGLATNVVAAPDEKSLIVLAEGAGLYWIPLE